MYTRLRLLTMDGDHVRVAEVVAAIHRGGDSYAIHNHPVSHVFTVYEVVEAPWREGIPTCRRDIRDSAADEELTPRELVTA